MRCLDYGTDFLYKKAGTTFPLPLRVLPVSVSVMDPRWYRCNAIIAWCASFVGTTG